MIAIASFFVFIILLLSLIVWLLQKYFELYSSLQILKNQQTSKLKQPQNFEKSKIEIIENEVSIIINERLAKLEQKFPTDLNYDRISIKIIQNFKYSLYAALNLLKELQ